MKRAADPSPLTLLRERAGLTPHQLARMTGYSVRTVYRWESGDSSPRKAVTDKLTSMAKAVNNLSLNGTPKFTFIDLFAGIGGMRIGFESVGGRCVFTSEWDKFCRQTYQANFDCNHDIAGDISKINSGDIPSFDLLLAGFPCQPFSIAGVSKKNSLGREHGFRDKTQGTLFFDIARILDYHKPAAFLLENVKNLLRHDRGNTFRVIAETLDELGYHWDKRVIDAKGYLPQHRERVFIAGFREDTGFSFEDLDVPDPESGPRLHCILHPQDGSEEAEPPYTEGPEALVNEKYTLSDRLWEYLQEYAEKHRRRGNGFGYGLNTENDVARTLSARYYKDGSEILIDQGEGRNPRRLTPRECARLMGFDGPDRKPFEIPVSDTQSYKQFGNAVAVPVVEVLARYMLPHILESREKTSDRQLSLQFDTKARMKEKELVHG